MAKEIMRMEHISKRFGDFYANKDVNISINEGEVLTLLGENGAGKSTLMNVLIGLYQPSEGKIFINGKEAHIDSPSKSVEYGIGMVHQHFMLVDAMTVLENIILGDTKHKGIFIDKEARKSEIVELAKKYKFEMDLDKSITELSVGEQQRVEILKALYRGADLLILDEPSAALTDIEVEGLFEMIETLKKEKKSIIFISHKMREVLHVSDRITILRAGEVVDTLSAQGVDGETLASMMIGRELSKTHYEKIENATDVVAELKEVSYHKASKHNGINNVSIQIKRGEIVGIAGVDGNGQSQLAQLLAGVVAPEEGEVLIKHNTLSVFDPNFFIKEGVAHVPEDRNAQGLIGDMTICENIVLKTTHTKEFSDANGLHLKIGKIKAKGSEMVEKYDIRCRNIDQPVRALSGGNQQKVILAREIESNPDFMITAHPTRGLDIGATRFTRDQMIAARDRGVGILLISADFDEILEMSDRIVVMFEGQIMGEFSGINPPIRSISLAMTGEVEDKYGEN